MTVRCGQVAVNANVAAGSSSQNRTAPNVQTSISLWDMDASTVIRADIVAEAITEDGFDLVFRTWGDTRVARARIGWMAIGELSDEDDWDVM